jgi:hypothetical protein
MSEGRLRPGQFLVQAGIDQDGAFVVVGWEQDGLQEKLRMTPATAERLRAGLGAALAVIKEKTQ